jgi:hypothetical protein
VGVTRLRGVSVDALSRGGDVRGIELDLWALRATLDQLRSCIERPNIIASTSVGLGHDRSRVLQSLGEIPAAATHADLAPRSAVSQVIRSYQREAIGVARPQQPHDPTDATTRAACRPSHGGHVTVQ